MPAPTLAVLSSPPPALTSAELSELSQSTPSSFEGIPPVLRHKEEDVEFTIEPAYEGFSTGRGSLFITEGALSFYSAATSTGLSIPYPLITLHAISRAPLRSLAAAGEPETAVAGGGPCIYCQIDEAEGDDEAEYDTREVIIVPSDPTALDKIFESLSTCAALHPSAASSEPSSMFGGLDPASMVYADADGNVVGPGMDGIEQMTEEEEANMMTSAGRAAQAHLESMISYPSKPKANGATEKDA